MRMIFLVSCSVYGFITHACQSQQGICSLFLIIVITILNNRSKSCLDSRKSELLHRDDVFVTEEFFFFWGGGGSKIGVPRYLDTYTDLEFLCIR